MESIGPGLARAASVDQVLQSLGRGADRLDLVGARGGAAAYLIARLVRRRGCSVVALTADAPGSRRLAADLRYFCSEIFRGERDAPPVLRYPEHDLGPFAELRPDRANTLLRLSVLSHLITRRGPLVVVVPAAAMVRLVVPRGAFEAHVMRLSRGEPVERDELIGRLAAAGYLRSPVVEEAGTMAVRGGLVDVYPPGGSGPVRIELDLDTVARIRSFEAQTQRTTEDLDSVLLDPASEVLARGDAMERALCRLQAACDEVNLPTSRARDLLASVESGTGLAAIDLWLAAFHERLSPLWDYLPEQATYYVDDPDNVLAAWREARAGAERARLGRTSIGQPALHVDDVLARVDDARSVFDRHARLIAHSVAVRGDDPWSAREPLDIAAADNDPLRAELARAAQQKGGGDLLAPLRRRLRSWLEEQGCRVTVVARGPGQAERLSALLGPHGTPVALDLDGSAETRPGVVRITTGELARGFHLPSEAAVWVADEEIFGSRRPSRRDRRGQGHPPLEDLTTLEQGQLVVHLEHGIGRYVGLVRRSVQGLELEFLLLEYQGGDKLYLPVYRLNQVHRYIGSESAALDRLGGATFAKRKGKARRAVEELADELLRVQAARRALAGVACRPADDLYVQFEATFSYEETAEQQRAIEEVLADLEAERPMDRLVCGDVGFGKTEVALRAALRVVLDHRQAAVLVPTTVLAQQHLETFRQRLSGFPVVVEALSRFRSEGEQADVIRRLKQGTVDVVVGTHRLLSRDVHFHDLGLLVVDEEHRFGVEHKERIKKLRSQVDVLTLTATPIPRTLQMALADLRDLSLITTPPPGRHAVRTYVTHYDEGLIRDAILREIARGGQVYYVRPRIAGLRERAEEIAALVPEARVAAAHGQLAESRLESIMLDFVAGRFDVLVCTSIVESGLDIPRANTLVVERADTFGLAQLYHLRGRVGRSTQRACAYLLVPPPREMTAEARRRLEALERLTAPGSGFAVATLDLEIRGAGEILGTEQSGHVASVGYEMYVQLLEEAVAELQGEPPAPQVDPELSFDVPGFIPETYVPDTGQRLGLYKRLAGASDDDEVREVAAEMRDRFGPAPSTVETLYRMMEVKAAARRLGSLGIEGSRRYVTVHLAEQTPLDPARVMALVTAPSSAYRLTPDMKLRRRVREGEFTDGVEAAAAVLRELWTMVEKPPEQATPVPGG